MRLIF